MAADYSSSSAAMLIFTMTSGSVTAPFCADEPFLIRSTCSMPWVTWPHTVYWPSRKVASSKTMKNCESALSGLAARAF